MGWSFLAAGLVAWRLRPDNAVGPAMVATGLLRFADALSWSQDPIIFAVSHFLGPAYLAGILFVLLAFPSGHLKTRPDRWLFGAGVLAAVPLHILWVLTGGQEHSGWCPACPPSLLGVMDLPELAALIRVAHPALGAVVAVGALASIAQRWRSASAALRFAISPVIWAGAAMSAVLALRLVSYLLGDPIGDGPALLLDLSLALVAGAFVLGVARTRLARSAVAELLADLGRTPGPGELQEALARALRDPSLEVAYWSSSAEGFVDAEGRAASLPPPGGARAVTVVEHQGRRIAALVHDPAVGDDESLVQAVAAAAGLQLENERLQADLRAQLEEVRASRARIAEAAEQERRRIERNLHDGTQQRLVSIAMALGLADTKVATDPAAAGALIGEARSGLSGALTELRELSQGIHPGLLTERGLAAAIEDVARGLRLPVEVSVGLADRLPAPVETAAYYVICEALANVVKHAAASQAAVDVARLDGRVSIAVSDDGRGGADTAKGSGLRGLRDRVEALGGRLSVESPPGRGTILRAEIPCA